MEGEAVVILPDVDESEVKFSFYPPAKKVKPRVCRWQRCCILSPLDDNDDDYDGDDHYDDDNDDDYDDNDYDDDDS